MVVKKSCFRALKKSAFYSPLFRLRPHLNTGNRVQHQCEGATDAGIGSTGFDVQPPRAVTPDVSSTAAYDPRTDEPSDADGSAGHTPTAQCAWIPWPAIRLFIVVRVVCWYRPNL